jgi:Uma2 family endonuclease
MAAKSTTVSLEEYLRTSYPNPDPEYVDGEIVERSMPTFLHGEVQALLCALFLALRKTLPLFVSSEARLRIRPTLIRIADVCVYHPERPGEAHPSVPPLVVIEILSDDDRMSEVRANLEEYRSWGAKHVWLIDPESRRFYTCSEAGLAEVGSLEVPELNFRLTASDLFS